MSALALNNPIFICAWYDRFMNQWYVVTGAPCSGKTTVLKILAERGYSIIPEVAREYIDDGISRGMTIEQIRADETDFQEKILEAKIKKEQTLPSTLTFFDRGIPDSYAYLKFLGIEDETALNASLVNHYKKVFILDPCPYKVDYARTETAEDQIVLDKLLEEAYQKSGITIIRVPVLETKEARVDFILGNL